MVETTQISEGQQILDTTEMDQQYKRGIMIPVDSTTKAYFVLDCNTKDLHVFRKLTQEVASVTMNIQGGEFLDSMRIVSDPEEGILLESFGYKFINGLQFTIISDSQQATADLQKEFEIGASMPAKIEKVSVTRKSLVRKSLSFLSQGTWKGQDMVVVSLEKVGNGNSTTPNKNGSQSKSVNPSNVVSGLGYGTKSMLSGVFGAVAGVVAEPVRGAKKGGIKGGAKGIGKGIFGLVYKPTKGAIDLVTQTTKGISNTPKTMYVSMTKIIKKKGKKNLGQEDVDPEDDIQICEQDGDTLYISRSELREQIERSQMLSALLYQAELSLEEEEQAKVKEIISRQRKILKSGNKEQVDIKAQQVKTITADLLNKLNEKYDLDPESPQYPQGQKTPVDENESDSMIEEREINTKLNQILEILRQKDGNGNGQSEQEQEGSDEDFYTEKMTTDVLDEASVEDLDLYFIETENIDQLDKSGDDDFDDQEFEQFFVHHEYISEEELEEIKKAKERTEKALILQERARNFKYITDRTDDYRDPQASGYGGFQLLDSAICSKLRSAGKEILKTAGKKILSGKFNLTQISFPIKCMCPTSQIESMSLFTGTFPIHLNYASQTKDLVERMKMVITSSVAFFHPAKIFEKPLNPILGETYQAYGQDGSMIFLEQTSHHPPISNYLIEGPNNNYRVYGHSVFVIKAYMNSANLTSDGQKTIEFKDGQKITFNNTGDNFYNLLMGTMGHQLTGQMDFVDEVNQIKATFTYGNIKKKPQDFFQGEITVHGQKVSTIFGNYMGFIDFDGVRYWDLRDSDDFMYFPIPFGKKALESDSTKRTDSVTLATGDVVQAQIEKENLEVLQRNDRKLREAAEKKRKS